MFHILTDKKLREIIQECENAMHRVYQLGYMEGQVHQRNIDFLARWECKPDVLHQAEQILREKGD
mgnify:CR=1 FL=1